jgi:predicted N-acetyltransferase YhbS
MTVSIREAQPVDAAACGRIVHAAFAAIGAQHNFPPDFPSVEVAAGIVSMLIGHPGLYAIVAEHEGKILGSNFLDMRSTIGGIGPITVDPMVQNKGIGQQLMRAVLERAAAKKMPGVRLVQDAFHNRSLSLYTVCNA